MKLSRLVGGPPILRDYLVDPKSPITMENDTAMPVSP